jgi:hypothetical protein
MRLRIVVLAGLLALGGVPRVTASTIDDGLGIILLDWASDSLKTAAIVSDLERLEQRPLDLNRASESELSDLPWATPLLARAVVEYRRRNGPFRHVRDVRRVPGMAPTLARLLEPFLAISPATGERCRVEARLRVRSVRPLSSGYFDPLPERRFLGSPHSVSALLRTEWASRSELCIITEKDAGEPDLSDHIGFSLCLRNLPFRGRVLLGKYRVNLGEGLLLGDNAWSVPALDAPFRPGRRRDVLTPYSGTAEGQGFAGIATSFALGDAGLSLFWSDRFLDASLWPSGTARSILEGGLHRNRREMSTRERLRETLWGGYLQRRLANGSWIGAGGYSLGYLPALEAAGHGFRGSTLSAVGSDMGLRCGGLTLFGELAGQHRGGVGRVTGAIVDGKPLRVVVLERFFNRRFFRPERGFASGSEANETGITATLRANLGPGTTLALLRDVSRHPGPRHLERLPTVGQESAGLLTHQFGDGLELFLQWSASSEEQNVAGEGSGTIGLVRAFASRAIVRWEVRPDLGIEVRYSMRRVRPPASPGPQVGDALSGALTWKGKNGDLISMRFTDFYTDSYDSRIYQRERNLSGTSSGLALSGSGVRDYVLVRKTFGRHVALSGRFATTHKYGVSSLGTDLDARPGDTECEYSLQGDFSW